MKKTVVIGLLVIVLAFGFIGCDDGNDNGNGNDNSNGNDNGTNWWIWHSSMADGSYIPTAIVNIIPSSDDTGVDVIVTGTVNNSGSWASQFGYDYTATISKTYTVSWKGSANNIPFENVTIGL